MRLLLLVFNLVVGASLLALTADTSVAASHKKTKYRRSVGIQKASTHPKGKKQLLTSALMPPKHAYRPSDVWERIRMGMQIYSLTDRFIFKTKGEIALDAAIPDTDPLLKSSAVLMRLYKFQRHNIDALKKLLKQPQLPTIGHASGWHMAQINAQSMPTAAANKTNQAQANAPDYCAAIAPKLATKAKIMPNQPGFISAKFVQGDLDPPVTMPKVSPHTVGRHKSTQTCVAQSGQANSMIGDISHTNYSLKIPNPLHQKTAYARVDKQIAWFVKRPEYLQMVAERARPYLYHIVDELSKHQLPLELALLPIVESAYKPTALSPMSAAGLWQFIPSTGRDFNLKRNGQYDERLDVTASTQAAIRFMSLLNSHFKGDWLLTLAAYNCGQGNVDAAIKRNIAKGLPTDYWSLSLPEETQNYVPRLLALANIFANPAKYQLNVKPVKNAPYFVKVNIDHKAELSQLVNKDLKTVAQLANMSYEQFSRLNPGYLNKTLAEEGPFSFIMPVANANHLQQKLDRLASAETDRQAPSPYLKAKFTEHFGPPKTDIVKNAL